MKLAVYERRCIGARRLLSLALDGEAEAADVLIAALHIERCEPCRRFAADVVEFTRALRSSRLELSGAPEIEHSRGGKS